MLHKGLLAVLLSVILVSPAFAETHVIAGAGTSTQVVQLFFTHFAQLPQAQGQEFIVPDISVKHGGGVKSTESNLFGRTGRPLSSEERQQGKEEILLAKAPIAFCVGSATGIQTLSVKQLEKVFTGQAANWKEVGGKDAQIVVVGRERTESVLSELLQELSFFERVTFNIVFDNDNQVIEFMKSPAGQYAITFGARSALDAAELKTIDMTGEVQPGVRLGLVYDKKNSDQPLIKAAVGYAHSEGWRKQLAAAGLQPVKAP